MRQKKEIVKCIRFNNELITKLEEIAEKKERTLSELIRLILKQYIRNQDDI